MTQQLPNQPQTESIAVQEPAPTIPNPEKSEQTDITYAKKKKSAIMGLVLLVLFIGIIFVLTAIYIVLNFELKN